MYFNQAIGTSGFLSPKTCRRERERGRKKKKKRRRGSERERERRFEERGRDNYIVKKKSR